MGIEVKMYAGKWQVVINETWQFDDLADLQKTLGNLLTLKDQKSPEHREKPNPFSIGAEGAKLD